MFLTIGSDPGDPRITADEAKELIKNHQSRDAQMDGRVTVKDMAETLGVPEWQVQQMVHDLRAQNALMPNPPISSTDWLKKRLWLWAVVAVGGMWLFGVGFPAMLPKSGKASPFALARKWIPTAKVVSFTAGGNRSTVHYGGDSKDLGKELEYKAPAGFSYKVVVGDSEGAILGDSDNYLEVKAMSKENIEILQKRLAGDIADAIDKTVKEEEPEWTEGRAIGMMEPNYYPGGPPVPIDLTLRKEAFPMSDSNPASARLKDQILQNLKANWEKVTNEEIVGR